MVEALVTYPPALDTVKVAGQLVTDHLADAESHVTFQQGRVEDIERALARQLNLLSEARKQRDAWRALLGVVNEANGGPA